jgi:hypothetical protein
MRTEKKIVRRNEEQATKENKKEKVAEERESED